jgi:UDP-N-acetylglucosamine 2-epimerase (non-hydrolysing)
MKMAPLLRALAAYEGVNAVLIHTGQHYDANLSDVFFAELGMKRPDILLEVGSGKHGAQTARILEKFEAVLEAGLPDGSVYQRVVVVGDVNSTLAAALAAAKLQIPVAHVEAGLRSFDRTMPEEINRIVTDSISDLLLVSEPAGMENLRREGHPPERLVLTGNVMIDTLTWLLPQARQQNTLQKLDLQPGSYGVVTLHRPANVDQRPTLQALLDVLVEVSRQLPLVFPVHPRTRARLQEYDLAEGLSAAAGIRLVDPLGYLDFLALTSQAKVIVTDSGDCKKNRRSWEFPVSRCAPTQSVRFPSSRGQAP